MNIRELTEVIQSNRKVIVKFYLDNCNPCSILFGSLQPICNKYNVKLLHLNANECSEIVNHFGLKSVPFTIKYVDGQIVDNFAGTKGTEYLDEFVSSDKKVEEKEVTGKKIPYAVS